MTALGDRPAIHLRRLMVGFGEEFDLVDGHGLPKAISGRAVGLSAWPDLEPGVSKGRVESMLAGRHTRPAHVEAIAAFFGVDAGLFYSEPDALVTTRVEVSVTPRGTVIIDVDGHELVDLLDVCLNANLDQRPTITVNGQPGAAASRTGAIGARGAYGCQIMLGPNDPQT